MTEGHDAGPVSKGQLADHHSSASAEPRVGRPPRLDGAGRPTRERLLAAAMAACVEHGFEGVTLGDIAARAGVSTPAIYNHFDGKSDLLVQACRWALARMAAPDDHGAPEPTAVVSRYLSPEFADARVLQLELHLASLRNPDVADLLAKWHGDNAAVWTDRGEVDIATVKLWYLVLLGLAQLDAVASLEVDHAELEARAQHLVAELFAEPPAPIT